MKLISPNLEQELDKQELNPFNISSARKALETALIYQLQALADGLFANLLLQGISINNIDWWYYYLTHLVRQNIPPSIYLPNFNDQNYTFFQKQFAQKIASRHIKPIGLANLNDIQIRIYGGFVKLWNDMQINKQLAKLGSSFRLAMVGSQDIAANEVRRLVEQTSTLSAVDGRFIFGLVDHLTASPLAPIFDFKDEFVVSPFVSVKGAGFCYQEKIVVRQPIIKMTIDTNSKQEHLESEEYQEQFHGMWAHTITHESIHITGGASWRRYPYSKAFWLEDTKRDICRFTQKPRSNEEIKEIYKYIFDTPLLIPMLEFSTEFLGQDLQKLLRKYSLEAILREMEAQDLITITQDGKVYSPIYEDGQRWKL